MAKKTRILFVLLLVLVMVFTAACSAKDTDKGNSDPSDTVKPQSTEPAGNSESQPVLDVAGTVLYDQDGIKVTVTRYDTEPFYGPLLYMTFANTSDKDVVVKTELLSANGYMMNDALTNAELAAGTEEESYFVFSNDEMKHCGIKELSQLQFYITVREPDTNKLITKSQLLTLDLTAQCDQTIDSAGQEVYNKDGIRILFKGVESDLMFQGAVYFLVENNSGKDISVYNKELILNDVACADFFLVDVRNGTVALDCIYLWELSNYNLESLDQIETIALDLMIDDYETADDIDTITVNIEN